MRWVYDDGGRKAAGFKGDTGDCVTRAIAIASGRPYQEVYGVLNQLAKRERPRRGRKRSSARTGVFRRTYERYLIDELGASWTPTMKIGQGCKVHLKADELPSGCLVVNVSKHVVAVIDGVIHDTSDPSRNETRCVYGYYTLPLGPKVWIPGNAAAHIDSWAEDEPTEINRIHSYRRAGKGSQAQVTATVELARWLEKEADYWSDCGVDSGSKWRVQPCRIAAERIRKALKV